MKDPHDPGTGDLEEAIARAKRRPPRRRKAMRAAATLTIPPSANSLFFNVPGKGRVKTDDYRDWLDAAGWELKAQKACKVPGHVAVRLCVGITRRRRDLDNIVKPTFDLLVLNGVIEDDSRVTDLHARWDRDTADGHIRVEIRQTFAPEKRPGSKQKHRPRRSNLREIRQSL